MARNSRSPVAAALLLALAGLAALGTGCFARKGQAETAPAPPPAECPEPEPCPAPEAVADPRVGELEAQVRRMEISVLEKESEVQDLEQRLASQQRMLDDAIQEVVRAKSKLRSLESRAEAASQLAETEIAFKALKGSAEAAPAADFLQIEQMMSMSASEFEKENFGGALYLSSQAKALIQEAQLKLSYKVEVPEGSGEEAFSVPIALKLLKRSNIRNRPGLDGEIIVTLDEGSPLTGHSHKGDWIRVQVDDSTSGWVHQSLVTGR